MDRAIKKQTHFHNEDPLSATIIVKLNEVIDLLNDHEKRVGHGS